jgi:hypothetical protein
MWNNNSPFPIGVDDNPLINSVWLVKNTTGTGSGPEPSDFLLTEGGDFILTEAGDNLATEGV